MVIVDAGGGTVDISSYSRSQKDDFEEIAPPQGSFIFDTLTNVNSLYIRSLPRFCFCDYPRKTVFGEYVVAKLGLLFYWSTSLPRSLERLTLSR